MTRWLAPLLRALTGYCDIHDRAYPAKIARLEVASGVDPRAEERLWDDVLSVSHFDPDLLDCGISRCRRRRGLAA